MSTKKKKTSRNVHKVPKWMRKARTMKPFIYVSGPYSSDPERNVMAAVCCAEEIYSIGAVPFVPHLSHLWHAQYPKGYEEWIEMDLLWIPKCDGLFRFAGRSDGADREVVHARDIGLPVFYDYPDVAIFVHDWLKGRKK